MMIQEMKDVVRKARSGRLALTLLACSGIAAQANAQNCDPATDMFVSATRFELPDKSFYLVVGDFNGDGIEDVTSVMGFSQDFAVQFGDGIDGLLPAVVSPLNIPGLQVRTIVSEDFNNDGLDDIAVATNQNGAGKIAVWFSIGDGTFGAPMLMDLVGQAWTIKAADFDSDGKMDIVVTHSYDFDPSGDLHDEHMTVFMGDGTGGFQETIYNTGRFAVSGVGIVSEYWLAGLAVADFDGDGVLDIAATNDFDFGDVTIFSGDGAGGFQILPERFPVGFVASDAASGDFNNDGNQDLVVTNTNVGGDPAPRFIAVLLGNGDGTFQPNIQYAVGRNPLYIEVADFDEDGNDDLVVTNALGVSVLLGDGAGSFEDQQVYQVGSGAQTSGIIDMNNDGHLDIVAPRRTGLLPFGTYVGFGAGDGTFAAPRSIQVGNEPRQVSLADLNGDGILDLVTQNRRQLTLGIPPRMGIMMGIGEGKYSNVQFLELGSEAFGSVVADFTSDGAPDILVAVQDTSIASRNLTLFTNNGDGSFETTLFLFAGPVGTGFAAADLNGDGHMDFAVTKSTGDNIGLGLGNGDGSFLFSSSGIAAGDAVVRVAAADMNGDGALDLVTTNALGDSVSIHLGNGDATYLPRQEYPVGDQPGAMAVADFDGDGNLDVVAVNAISDDISVLMGIGDGTLQPEQRVSVGDNPASLTVADLDGNGILDLAVVSNGSGNTVAETSILFGLGDGTFDPAINISNESTPIRYGAISIAAADINGDMLDDLVVANGAFLTGTVSILVNQCGMSGDLCAADLTGEGDLNFLDVSAFLKAFGAMDPAADFSEDGMFNFLDVSAFLAAFAAGCP